MTSQPMLRQQLGFGLAGIAILLRMSSDWLFAEGGPLPYHLVQASLLMLALAAIWSHREIVFLKGGRVRRAVLEGSLAIPLGLVLGVTQRWRATAHCNCLRLSKRRSW